MSTYEPGTIAVIKDRFTTPFEWRAVKDDKGWASTSPKVGWVSDADVLSVRPLVVLDLSEYEASVVCTHLRSVGFTGCVCSVIADQIEAQTKPPRIPEPGWGEIVEARAGREGAPRRRFVRSGRDWSAEDGTLYLWKHLIDPALVRPGIEESS